ncbi:MAG: prephenate dehydrogenase [Rikenellaceae bacterium]|nr:prephenate dehydrogenase [Rikenellaceae bacterium]
MGIVEWYACSLRTGGDKMRKEMKAAIIGIGLIGGSFALSLRDNGLCSKITGVDRNPENARKALELGLVDEVTDMEEAVAGATLVVIATPVDSIPLIAVKILNNVRPDQVVIDTGSIKGELYEVIRCHPNRGRFVATHPMWGTEYSGPEAAVRGAFKGRTVVVCDSESSDRDALRLVEGIYEKIGMPVSYMSSEEQDLHSAYVSHISHITSFALALTVLEKEREEEHIFDLAGGGFESTVRLAKSSPQTWVPILLQNKYNVLDVLREHIHQLNIIRKMLERDDRKGLGAAIEKANSIKKIIEKTTV